MPRGRINNRRMAVDHVAEQMQTDALTTDELWFAGQSMLRQTWPKNLKQAWRGISSADHLGNIMARHPGWMRDSMIETRDRYGRRFRTSLWIRRSQADSAQE